MVGFTPLIRMAFLGFGLRILGIFKFAARMIPATELGNMIDKACGIVARIAIGLQIAMKATG